MADGPLTAAIEHLLKGIRDCSAHVAVIGLGYVGLPMGLEFARAGFRVSGLDADLERCASLQAGHSYIEDLTDADLQAAQATGRFRVTASTAVLAEADVIMICVPTPLRKSKDPDLTAILSATSTLAQHLRPGQLVILESTTYPGTTEEVLLPMLSDKGMQVGRDFFLAFSPERVDPGNTEFGVRKITKLVGACTPLGTRIAVEFYGKVIETVAPVSSTRVAEAAKLLENTFRSVNIALANEMSIICKHLGVDVWEVIDAAATKPFGFMAHFPGPGIGGHCIPLDPHYLSWKARLHGYEPRFISLATEINAGMPRHVVEMIAAALNDRSQCLRGSRVLVLGVAYKANVSDSRESPALEILKSLASRGVQVSYSDPFVPSVNVGGLTLHHEELTAEVLRDTDCAVIVTDHAAFDYGLIVAEAPLVVDTRNATRRAGVRGNVQFL